MHASKDWMQPVIYNNKSIGRHKIKKKPATNGIFLKVAIQVSHSGGRTDHGDSKK